MQSRAPTQTLTSNPHFLKTSRDLIEAWALCSSTHRSLLTTRLGITCRRVTNAGFRPPRPARESGAWRLSLLLAALTASGHSLVESGVRFCSRKFILWAWRTTMWQSSGICLSPAVVHLEHLPLLVRNCSLRNPGSRAFRWNPFPSRSLIKGTWGSKFQSSRKISSTSAPVDLF